MYVVSRSPAPLRVKSIESMNLCTGHKPAVLSNFFHQELGPGPSDAVTNPNPNPDPDPDPDPGP